MRLTTVLCDVCGTTIHKDYSPEDLTFYSKGQRVYISTPGNIYKDICNTCLEKIMGALK